MTTKAIVTTVLANRCGPLMTKAGMTITALGDDFNDPLAWAIRQCGLTTADPSTPTDAEVAAVAATDTDKLLDLAELRLLETIISNLDSVDTKVGPREEKLDQLAQRVAGRITRLQARIELLYGLGAGFEAGTILVEFAEHATGGDTDE